MTANTVLNAGSGGDTIQTIDNTTYKTQVVAVGDSTGANIASVTPAGQLIVRTLDTIVTGNITTNGGTITSVECDGCSTASVQLIGTWVGTVAFEGSLDNTNWFALNASPFPSGAFVTTTSGTGQWIINSAGVDYIRVRATAFTSGSIAVTIDISSGIGIMGLVDALPAGTNLIGKVQELKDVGRNQTNYFTLVQVLTTAAEVMQSLTGYKGGVAVTATATPAVVTTGKTYRINLIVITYVGVTTAGSALVTLRCNLTGTAVVGSPLVSSWSVGGLSTTAGVTQTVSIPIPEGIEFPAGAGIGVGVTGIGANGTAAVVGYCKVSVNGYEY